MANIENTIQINDRNIITNDRNIIINDNINQGISIREASDYLRYELYREDDSHISDENLITYIDMNLERFGFQYENTRNYILNEIRSGISFLRLERLTRI